MNRRKSIINTNRVISFICIVILFNILGVGYGSWSQSIYVNNTMHTGNFDVSFIKTNEIISENVTTEISEDSKIMTITLNNVLPNSIYNIPYTFMNNGSLEAFSVSEPTDVQENTFPGVLTVNPPSLVELAVGKTADGIIKIIASNIKPCESYNYTHTFSFNHASWDDKLEICININSAEVFHQVSAVPLVNPILTEVKTEAPKLTQTPVEIPTLTQTPTEAPKLTETPVEIPTLTQTLTETPKLTETP